MALVSNWKALWKAWSMQLAAAGILLPELLQLIADNSDLLPWLGPDLKSLIRVAALVGVILTRPIQQPAVSVDEPKP